MTARSTPHGCCTTMVPKLNWEVTTMAIDRQCTQLGSFWTCQYGSCRYCITPASKTAPSRLSHVLHWSFRTLPQYTIEILYPLKGIFSVTLHISPTPYRLILLFALYFVHLSCIEPLHSFFADIPSSNPPLHTPLLEIYLFQIVWKQHSSIFLLLYTHTTYP